MKKTLVLLAALALTAGTASAQTNPAPASPSADAQLNPAGPARRDLTPEQHADRLAGRLTKQLGLSADQTIKMRETALAHHQEAQALRSKYATAGNRKGMGQEMKALRDKYDAQLKGILSADQYAKYDQLRDDKIEKHKEQRQNGKLKVK